MEDDREHTYLYEMASIDPLPGKKATEDQLLKWRKSVLALNSSRRFRYAANFENRKKDEEARKATFRSRALVVQAATRFLEGGKRRLSREGKHKEDEDLTDKEVDLAEGQRGDFGVGDKELARMMENNDEKKLDKLGGPQGCAKALKADPKKGIPADDADVKSRQKVFGTNTYPEKAAKGFLVFVWEAFQDVTLIILMVCAFVSLAVGIATEGIKSGWYDGAGILLSITLVVLVTATTDYQQSLQFQSLNKEKQKIYINVNRAGRRQKVLIFDIVVGDVVHLSIGDQIPADGVVLESNSLMVDESQMTGESEPKKKSVDEPFLMSGCKIADGGGRMLITAVGMNTEWGRLMSTLSSDDTEETPLQVRLNSVATMIGQLGLTVAILVFFILIGKFLYKKDFDFSGWSGQDTLEVVDFFAIAVTIIVVSVPEGLPLAVTLTLAFAMHKMMEQKALVRHLSACETMGSSTTICSDKTGTLTMNEMTVVKAWVGDKVHDDPAGAVKDLPKDALEALTEAMCFNTTGDVYIPEGGSEPEVSGSPTESAILKFALAVKTDFKAVRTSGKELALEPFSSAKKRMGVVVMSGQSVRAHWKGASEIVLGLCDRYVDKEGEPVKLTQEKKDELLKVIDGFAKASLRTIAFGYCELDSPGVDSVPDDKLICQAIVGIKDPPRPGVKKSIKLCHKAGIVVRMVTGDNLTTAQAISKEIGILDMGGEVIEGPKFRDLSEDEMRELVPKLRVMARSSPTDKNLLVKHLRAHGEVVAATGDGTNDAPALHEADIGLAMGIAGTEVAKESADIVILDDNFSSIVNVAKWGRSVYANIQKFVQFQLTVNIVALALNFISAVITGDAPLTAVQLLWVNLIMDTLGALALATEPPTDELMTRSPVGRHSSLITNVMWRNIFLMAIYQLAVLLVLQFAGKNLLGLGNSKQDTQLLQTIIFNSFVLCQVFNEFNSRHTERINVFKNLINNRVFMGVIAFTLLVQTLLVQIGGFIGQIADTTPLSLEYWGLCVGLGFLSMPISAIIKCLPVPKKPLFTRPKRPVRRDGGDEYHALPEGEPNGGSSV